MKIKEGTDEQIIFDNGSILTYTHEQDCCEYNYADFSQLDKEAYDYAFTENELQFEIVEGSGFRFGSRNGYKMFFIPCYSEQNGYYSSDILIEYTGSSSLHLDCQHCW